MFENLMDEVPDYKAFYTIDELNSSSEELAHKHPERVKVSDIGKSRKGEKIKKLSEAALKQDKQQISTMLLEIADIEERTYKLLKDM